ncbi:MAG: hypothetical protein ACLR4A_04235 [Christensenellales bacterium]
MKDMKQETGTEKKEDRRVRRTKKLLSQGLIELMQQKQVKEHYCARTGRFGGCESWYILSLLP